MGQALAADRQHVSPPHHRIAVLFAGVWGCWVLCLLCVVSAAILYRRNTVPPIQHAIYLCRHVATVSPTDAALCLCAHDCFPALFKCVCVLKHLVLGY